jgi:hypothetical protein
MMHLRTISVGLLLVVLAACSKSNGGGGGGTDIKTLSWSSVQSGTGNTLFGIASSTSAAAAVGSLGTILTSADGSSWAKASSGVVVNLNGVATSGTLFAAVGDSGTIVTSPDLIAWTPRTSGTTNRLRGIAWTGSQFIAVGDVGTIITSPDGFTWTGQTSGTANDLYGVAGSSTQSVAVGNAATILSSPTGSAWTPQISSQFGGNNLRSVTWSGVQFLITGESFGSNPGVQTSYDGVSWTGHSAVTGALMNASAWSGTLYTVVGTLGARQVSADGISWATCDILQSTFKVTVSLNGVTWFKNRFIAVGEQGTIIAGIRDPSAPGNDVDVTLFGAASSSSAVVLVGALGAIITSTDGASSTRATSNVTVNLNGVATSGTLFVAAGDLGTIVTTSDLVTWTPRISGVSKHLRGVAWTGSQFIAVGDTGTILTSPDGMTWATQTSGTTNDLYGVAGNSTLSVAVGNGGTILTSPTGSTWTPRTSAPTGGSNLRSVTWSGVQFLVTAEAFLGSVGTQTSLEGVTWTAHGVQTGSLMTASAWSGTEFAATGTFGILETSADGLSWKLLGPIFFTVDGYPNSVDFYGVTWFRGQFIAVGRWGVVETF